MPGKFLRRPGGISGKVLALQRRIECSALERLLLLIRPPQGDLFGVYLCRTSCFNGPRLNRPYHSKNIDFKGVQICENPNLLKQWRSSRTYPNVRQMPYWQPYWNRSPMP